MKCDNYRKLLFQAPFGYAYHRVITDSSGKAADYEFIEINNAFESITGLKAADILNKRVTEVIPDIGKDSFDWIGEYGSIAILGGEKEFERFSEPLKKWYKVQAFSFEKYYFSTIIIDITMEKEQRDELERFFSVNLDLLCIADTDGNFVKTNKAWESVLGYSSKELEKKKFLDFVHPDDIPGTLEAISALSSQKQVLNFVNRYRSCDGQYRYIQWRSHPYGNLIYAAARDITEQRSIEEALRESEGKYRLIAENAADLIWILDLEKSRFLYVSPSVEKLRGYTPEEVMGYPMEKGFCPESLILLQSLIAKHSDEFKKGIKKVYVAELEQPRKDGTTVWTEVTFRYDYDSKTGHLIIHGASRDISERRKAEMEVKFQNGFQKLVADISSDFINATTENIDNKISSMLESAGYFFNADRCILALFSLDRTRVEFVSEWCREGIDSKAEKIKFMKIGSIPWMRDQVELHGHLYLFDTDELLACAEAEKNVLKTMKMHSFLTIPVLINNRIEGYFSFHFVNNKTRMEERHISLLKVIANIVSDAVGRNRLEQELMKASITDPLTGLYNRRYLFTRLYPLAEEGRRKKNSFSVMMFDIDHFKKVNDSAGHPAGDYILQNFAEIIKGSVRMFDIVCRYGGEEFLAVIIGSGRREALATAERILDKTRKSIFSYEGKELRITVSCGISDSYEMIDEGISPEALIEKADKRLYSAKQSGRDRCVFLDEPDDNGI